MFRPFYLPENIYYNLSILAKENKVSITDQIITCLEYTRINPPPKNRCAQYSEEKLPYINTVHFTERYSSPRLKKYISTHELTPIQIVNNLDYGQHYKEIEDIKNIKKRTSIE